ncbi:unnamed protein product [Auanema sp. JU1783]|nr:unnamed protein product [Auanema sp. JU1783]
MIVLVWSLVSSVVELARRKRLASFLDRFLSSDLAQTSVLLCTRTTNNADDNTTETGARLVRYTSEPQLNAHKVLYRTENAQVSIEQAQPLTLTDWRFVPSSAFEQSEEQLVFFLVIPVRVLVEEDSDSELTCTVYLQSSCERIAWNRLRPASIYVCPVERFVDVVYAFSEGALYENNRQSLIESVQTISKACLPETSGLGSSSSITKKALPLLEQLYWGDSNSLSSGRKRFVSEQTLLPGSFGSLPRQLHISPRRRHRSCNYSSSSLASTPRKATITLFGDLAEQSLKFFENNQLPPYLRYIDNRDRRITLNNKPATENMSLPSSNGVSPSITIEELDQRSSCRSEDESDIPFVDDSTLTSPQSTVEKSSFATVIHRQENPWSSRDLTKSECAKIISGIETLCEEKPYVNKNETNIDLSDKEINKSIEVMLNQHMESLIDNHEDSNKIGNGKIMENNGHILPIQEHLPPSGSSATQPRRSPQRISTTTTAAMSRSTNEISRRRHSAMPGTSYLDSDDEHSARFRSLSPIHHNYYHRRSISGRSSDILFERQSFRRPYTPTRKFLSSKAPSDRAMFKPPSILVYTGQQQDLFRRIRNNLTRILPENKYTVFNISAEAIKKQPWIEPTTSCLVIADTKNLDDAAWAKMQTYFNQAGKIIFVCQNRLLASLTECDSTKKQADILRMAFGSRDLSMGKEFEQFLKKSLKSLTKHGQVNEKFHSKDLIGGLSYSVVLSKTSESPLFLYMQNSAHQAAAIFSDATSEQLLAPGSKILSESLSRIGVTVTLSEIPALTRAHLVAKDQNTIKNLQGVRYGEEIGTAPKLFLRTAENFRENGLPSATEELVPVIVGESEDSESSFNFKRFFDRLTTARIGHVCMHIPVATTTMDVSDSLSDAIPTCDNFVIIAGQQVSGKGAAMFTCSVTITKGCLLAQNPSFAQHIFAVAIADAICSLSGHEDFPVKIKWPNDFFFNRSHKLGGLLATCRTRDDSLFFTLGAGINVTNSQPTVCLNDIVPEGDNIEFTVEDVIAECLNKFEYWLSMYELRGQNEFLKKYYQYWLHSREEVLLEDHGEKCIIRGLDKYGYLQVRSKTNPNKLFSLGDDGNTFDMMKGLIRHKI